MTQEVIDLLQIDINETLVQKYIDYATLIVADCNWQQDRKDAIINWITAHLITSTDEYRQVVSESYGNASITFSSGPIGESLKSTTYGQQALLLDNTGCLNKLGKSKGTIEVI